MTHFVAVKEDITLRKKVATELKLAEEALRQQAALLRSMTGTTPYSFYVHDNRRDKILYFNRRFCEIWGLEDLQERLDRGELRHSEIFPRFLEKVADPEAFTKYCEPLRHSDNASTMEATIQLRDGRIVHHSSMQIRDEKDELLGRLCLMEDVTQQKLAAQQLAGSLQQKEILLREVYHRVKNNLQVISSLLNLQSSAITDPRTLRLIRETQDRVRSIALVHEKLYRADDLSQIDFAEYTQQLVTMLARSYRTQGYAVNLQFSLQKVLLNLDTSIPCGLILNELISNALKYAFTALPPRQAPEIKVDLQATGPGLYVLSVADNGSGLPPQIDIHNTTSLGLQVVTMLAEQLSGSITVDRNSGTKFTLAFAEVKDRAAGRVPAPPGPPVPAPLPPHPAAAT